MFLRFVQPRWCLIVNGYVLVISKLMLFNFRDRSDICVAFNSSLGFDCRRNTSSMKMFNRWNILSIGIERRPTRLKFINLWCLLNGPCSTIKENVHTYCCLINTRILFFLVLCALLLLNQQARHFCSNFMWKNKYELIWCFTLCAHSKAICFILFNAFRRDSKWKLLKTSHICIICAHNQILHGIAFNSSDIYCGKNPFIEKKSTGRLTDTACISMAGCIKNNMLWLE